MEFRAEAFNVFNHTQFRIYDPSHPGNTGNNVINCYGDITTGYSAGASSCLVGNSFLHPVDAHDRAHPATRSEVRVLGEGDEVSGKVSVYEDAALLELRQVLAAPAGAVSRPWSSVWLAGCNTTAATPASTAAGPPGFTWPPAVAGGVAGVLSSTAAQATYSIDDAAKTFSQATYNSQAGTQLNYSGTLSTLPARPPGHADDLCELPPPVILVFPSHPRGWAVELADQTGGLVQFERRALRPDRSCHYVSHGEQAADPMSSSPCRRR